VIRRDFLRTGLLVAGCSLLWACRSLVDEVTGDEPGTVRTGRAEHILGIVFFLPVRRPTDSIQLRFTAPSLRVFEKLSGSSICKLGLFSSLLL
jgi:hypothetical protein